MDLLVKKLSHNKGLQTLTKAITQAKSLFLVFSIMLMFYLTLDRVFVFSEIIHSGVSVIYLVLMIVLGFIMSDAVINEYIFDNQFKRMGLFLSFLSLAPFLLEVNLLPLFPIIVLFVSLFNAKIAELINRIIEAYKKDLGPIFNNLKSIIFLIIYFTISLVIFVVYYRFFDQIVIFFMGSFRILSHYISMILIVVCITFLSYKGIKGLDFVGLLLRPFWLGMLLFNGFFLLIDLEIPYIASEVFFQWFVWIGGTGSTLGLSLVIKYMSRSKELKELSKLSWDESLLNINQSLIQGLPLVNNKVFLAPFIFTPLILSSLSYYVIASDWIKPLALLMPSFIPSPLGGFLSSLLSLRVLFFITGLILISVMTYLPFVRYFDQQLLKKELYDK